ncbi:MAG: CDP-alcohol phosphatidyltransferase family protein [Anaerolineae bacterium]|jgi:CDP-diacylglycerol--glycerol-3-phosphate 3-phosphatidyltransferase
MANTITLARLPLLIVVVLLLYVDNPIVHIITAGLVLLLIFMDTLDGMVARRRKETGMLGSKLDIAVDRIVEQVLWIVYAHLHLISVAIPVIFIIRGGLVDTVRSFSLIWGETSFGMMQTKWGRRLVASGFMRSLYGISKAAAFCLLALAMGLQGLWAGTPKAGTADAVLTVAVVLSWIATVICVVRGAPVLLEAPSLLRDLDDKVADKPN